MNKKNISILLSLFIVIAVIYFFNIGGDNQYCNYRLGWDKCDGEVIQISGNNPSTNGMIDQHPMMSFDSDIVGPDTRPFQNYLDTRVYGQIILLSSEDIDCPNKMTIFGTLQTNVGPCKSDVITKDMYCGSSIIVSEWVCD